MSTHVPTAVLARLKQLTGAQSDAELSRKLSISPQTLSSWKIRDSVPYSLCIDIARQYECSLDWLLLGEMFPAPARQGNGDWECEMLEQLRALSPGDRQATLLFIKDRQRIQQLEQRVSELTLHSQTAGGS